MELDAITELAARQDWVAPIEEGLQKAVSSAFKTTAGCCKVEDALHGTWLGHPLHPVLTDVPVGAWTVAVALDAMDAVHGDDENARGADAAVGIGLIGAAGAAITGLTDWHKTDGKARRVGVIHGLLNVGATGLFAASLILRRNKKRDAAKVCSLAGYLVVLGSAYLGGSLVYAQKIGVDNSDREDAPEGFVPVLAEPELEEGTMRRVEAPGGFKVLLVRQNGRIHALGDTCAHLGGPLSEGTLEEGSVRCPWHGSCFALEDGRVLEGPSTYPQPNFEVRVRGGQIEVRALEKQDGVPSLELSSGS